LIKNSVQSLNERKKCKVNISIIKTANEVVIKISDNGKGIPDNQKDKIFVPHFTTKSTGSGIGLSVVRQIIENQNGTISFESIENDGTTFRIAIG